MKTYTTDKGSRCSGWGVYPDGRKCRGCSDCKGGTNKQKLAKSKTKAKLKTKTKK
jgi:hypothetical protein